MKEKRRQCVHVWVKFFFFFAVKMCETETIKTLWDCADSTFRNLSNAVTTYNWQNLTKRNVNPVKEKRRQETKYVFHSKIQTNQRPNEHSCMATSVILWVKKSVMNLWFKKKRLSNTQNVIFKHICGFALHCQHLFWLLGRIYISNQN